MTGKDKIIAGTAFEIVARSFTGEAGAERNSFRLKNLTKNEALEFIRIWTEQHKSRFLDDVRLLVASDSHDDFPQQYKADPQHSITYYRNNNQNGLVYIETKVESDEQGLKNLFTLRDINFLDGTFDVSDEFRVPDEMATHALLTAGATSSGGYKLMRDRLVEIVDMLTAAGMTIPVRKYAALTLASAKCVTQESGVFSSDEIDALVGKCLIELDMFPDENWREKPSQIGRRLSLNLLRAELAASPSADLDAEKTAERCLGLKFVDENDEPYSGEEMKRWRLICHDYCLAPNRELRECIPYRIFEQIFEKDVKGLPLGERVAEEILDRDPSRKQDFDVLDVEIGLNQRSIEDARKFLESEPSSPDTLPLSDLLSKQTLRRVEKLASPAAERVKNPLIKLAEVTLGFRKDHELDSDDYTIELRAGPGVGEQHSPTLALFAFLYGKSLEEIASSLSDGLSSIALKIDRALTKQREVPSLVKELGTDPDHGSDNGSTSEEDEGTIWLPFPIEIALIDERGTEIDSVAAMEWFPEDIHYLVLFWISVCGEDRGELNAEIIAPHNKTGEEWIRDVAHRLFPFAGQNTRQISDVALKNPIISQLVGIRSKFRANTERSGLSSEMLNDIFDNWLELLADARRAFLPIGEVPVGMPEFINADSVQGFDGDRVLMLPSHPLKLRWIASYLAKSRELAASAIEGTLQLNVENEQLYLNWIQGLSPHQQPAVHNDAHGNLLFADGERGWCESFQPKPSSGGTVSGDKVHSSLVGEIVRQILAYLHAHPYKTDGLKILIVTNGASALPADIVQEVRKGEFKDLSMTIELVAPKPCWDEATRHFEMVDTSNRLSGDGALFPPVQLNLHSLEDVRLDADGQLGNMNCDLAIVPQFLDDKVDVDHKTEDDSSEQGKFDALLDDPTYIASGAGSAALWVSLRPKMPDFALSSWSTLAVRHDRKSPVAKDRIEATDFVDIRINFHNTAQFFGALHNRSHWVITVERHITREQIEKLETRPEVLSLRDGVGPGGLFTLIVSSNAGKQFVVDRLTRKLTRIAQLIGRPDLAEAQSAQLAANVYQEARQISPRLTLDALGISRVTEEILGLSIARQIANQAMAIPVSDGFVAWISIDEHPEWFPSPNSIRADMIRLAVDLKDDGLAVNLLVLESKLRRSQYDAHGAEQVLKTLKLLDAVFSQEGDMNVVDGELWRDMLLSAVDTVGEDAFTKSPLNDGGHSRANPRISEDVRSKFRKGDFASVKLSGLYSICEYTNSREVEIERYDQDERVLIVRTGGRALLDRKLAAAAKEAQGSSQQAVPKPDPAADAVTSELKQTPPEVPVEETSESAQFDDRDQETASAAAHVTTKQNGTAGKLGENELARRYQVILDTFGQYNIQVGKTDPDVPYAIEGPASILFRVRPGRGVAPAKLIAQHDALKLALELEASQDIRFDIDKGYVTIDVPKLDEDRYFVSALDIWQTWKRPASGLSVPLGEDRFGDIVEIDFTSSNSPHLLIGGTTGSGKSEALNTILAGMTEHYSANEVRLQLIDPKGTELEHFNGSEHLDGEIGWDEEDAISILERAVSEMQDRYARFKSVRVRSLSEYNSQAVADQQIARWVIVLDEYADLTSDPDAKRTIENHLRRLAQKARAAGIHVIIATQKPDASVISTNLRSNLPAQIALRVKSGTESRVIMDDTGAESLTGKGDAFFKESGVLTRVQCAKV